MRDLHQTVAWCRQLALQTHNTGIGVSQCLDKAADEIMRLWTVLQDISDAKEPKDDRATDDADWRFAALEMKRVAKINII